jgi:hypothetical protein
MEEEEEIEIICRSSREVAERVVALISIVDRAFNQNPEKLDAWTKKSSIARYFTPLEKEFYDSQDSTDDDITNFSWRTEAVVPLLWALREIDSMPPLKQQIALAEIPATGRILQDPDSFIANAALRPQNELEEMEGKLYHEHWRVRDAQLFEKPMPDELHPGIVYERRYAASWLVGWGDDFDDVPTDT